MNKKMGAPLKRDTRLLSSGITAELDSKYRELAEHHGVTKTDLKRLALEYVMSMLEKGALDTPDITGVLLPRKEK